MLTDQNDDTTLIEATGRAMAAQERGEGTDAQNRETVGGKALGRGEETQATLRLVLFGAHCQI